VERLVSTALRLDDSLFCKAPEVVKLSSELEVGLEQVLAWTGDPASRAPLETVKALSESLASSRKQLRLDVLDRTAQGMLSPEQANDQIEASRRLDEIGYYVWRITEHLRGERIQLTE